jgi:hypothetical protein
MALFFEEFQDEDNLSAIFEGILRKKAFGIRQ